MTIKTENIVGKLNKKKQEGRLSNIYSAGKTAARGAFAKGARAGGRVMMQRGAAMSTTGAGAIAGLPMMAAGGLATAAGTVGGMKNNEEKGQTESLAGQLRGAKSMEKMALKAATKVAPAPIKVALKAADFAGIDVVKVFKIMMIVNVVMQFLFWIAIVLMAAYVLTHTWEMFKMFWDGIWGAINDKIINPENQNAIINPETDGP